MKSSAFSINAHCRRLVKRVGVLFFLVLFGLSATGAAWAGTTDLGVLGKVYPIAEADALAEIKARAAKLDMEALYPEEERRRMVLDYRPDTVKLPRAAQTGSYLVDMTYTLDFDIPDGKGGILYPKGYTFNPLDYMQLPKTYVIIDGSDEGQIAWYRNSPYAGTFETELMITDGPYMDLMDTFNRPVFYAVRQVCERFQLRAVPSVVRQDGRFIRVFMVAMDDEDDENRYP